jgi:hypothetical protein
MKRMILLLTVALVMAAVVVATAVPAFAAPRGHAYGYKHGKECHGKVGHKTHANCGLHNPRS